MKLSSNFWLVVVGLGVTGLIIWGLVALEGAREKKIVGETSREVALTCTTDMATRFHIHPHLQILINGQEEVIPANTGINGLCMNSIHTHDATGLLHVEAPVQKDFTLGDFFAVWDKTFSKEQILDYKADATHAITLSVNGKEDDSYENYIFKDKDQIVINYGEMNKENITNSNNQAKTMSATLKTSKGDITIEFFDKQAPNTVANFLKLAKAGFYSGIKFHRVIKGFMIQGGDPLTKDDSKMAQWGTGGPGYSFADEIDAKSDLYVKTGYAKGIVAMANSGPNTNGSQFFIMTENYPLPPSYTIFGKVTSGQEVVDAIANVKTVKPGVLDRPVSPVVIESVTLK